jgi:hypothetical protein
MAASIRSPFTIGDWHSTHTGAAENVKLSRIHPLQPSAEQDHIEVNSSGASSTGFFREKYMREPSFSFEFSLRLSARQYGRMPPAGLLYYFHFLLILCSNWSLQTCIFR